MTIFELSPWFVAIGVTVLSAALLTNKIGLPGLWAWMIAGVLGITSWASYWLALKKLGLRFDQRRAEKAKRELEGRKYQDFDASKGDYPTAKNLYYECLVCGNVVPSTPGRNISCKCRNVVIDASGRPTVQNHEKTKLFSVSE